MNSKLKLLIIVISVALATCIQCCNVLQRSTDLTFTPYEGDNFDGFFIIKNNDTIGFLDLTDSITIYCKDITPKEAKQALKFGTENKRQTIEFK